MAWRSGVMGRALSGRVAFSSMPAGVFASADGWICRPQQSTLDGDSTLAPRVFAHMPVCNK